MCPLGRMQMSLREYSADCDERHRNAAHPPRPEGVTQPWGVIRLPQIGPISHMPEVQQKTAHDLFVTAHTVGGWMLVALLLLHVVGACKHQWFDGHSEFFRMGIGRGKVGSERR
jgi:hypothetical protein